MVDIFPIKFSATQTALAAHVQDASDLPQAVRDLGLPSPRPVIVLIGGAGGMTETDLARLRPLFEEALASTAEELGAVVVDGGTDAGVMRLMGQARATQSFLLVGVLVEQLAGLPLHPLQQDQWTLEAHHTHFFLIPGSKWGHESIWISQLATVLAGSKPSVTVLVNGGEIAYQDLAHSVRQNRPVVIVEGSGRTADVLAAALHGVVQDERAGQLAASGLLTGVPLADGPIALRTVLNRLLRSA